MRIPDHDIRELPEAPKFSKMVGPSLILLGLGLGSGEVVLWPYLSANFGLGIIWAALVGITLQFFLNMEVTRYALIKGESVFVGFARWSRYYPLWFIVSTFVGFGWPGIVASSAKILANATNIERFDLLAIGLLILIGIILSFGKTLYKTVETYQKISISIGIPVVILITFLIARSTDWTHLFNGLIGKGEGYSFLPQGIPIFTFLGALAYAGAGGNLNLAQSFYVRDKGYAMGVYGQGINSVLRGIESDVSLVGATFEPHDENHQKYKKWWRLVNLEHGIVFWGLGLLTICLLSLLSYATVYGTGDNGTGINFLINESASIAKSLTPFVGSIFLLVTAALLFGTQLTVLDSISRIITENIVLYRYDEKYRSKVPQIYYAVLWGLIFFGCLVFTVGFSEPRTLVVLGAVANAVAMFISFILMLRLNTKTLPKKLRPSWFRRLIIVLAIAFFAVFVILAILNGFGIVR